MPRRMHPRPDSPLEIVLAAPQQSSSLAVTHHRTFEVVWVEFPYRLEAKSADFDVCG